MVAPISLARLPEQLRLELLFVAQQFTLQRRKRSRGRGAAWFATPAPLASPRCLSSSAHRRLGDPWARS